VLCEWVIGATTASINVRASLLANEPTTLVAGQKEKRKRKEKHINKQTEKHGS